MMGGTSTGQATTLATLEVTGEQAAAPSPVPVQPVPTDLRGAQISGRRTLTFAMGMGMGMGGGMTATIDGATFDPRRVDQDPRSGTVEEWVLRNTSTLSHPVHLHVWPMQVVSQDGTLVAGVVVRDVVDVPAGASVTVRIAFTGPVGRTVYHCHILDHEDAGMMGVVDVR
jgi:FtsP/CotA-like multicopper oxidase with cupredoxin domain